MKVCASVGCPTLVKRDAFRGLCPECARKRDRERGTTTERGYGAEFRATRAAWADRISAGERVICWRCEERVGLDFHLGHDDHDRAIIRGPEHALCNLRAAGRASHGT